MCRPLTWPEVDTSTNPSTIAISGRTILSVCNDGGVVKCGAGSHLPSRADLPAQTGRSNDEAHVLASSRPEGQTP